ncbi:MAG: VanW family protein, partial [Clostridia bacterium]
MLRKIVTSQLLFAIIFLFASGMFLPFVFLRDKAIAESQNFARDQLAELSTSQNLTCNQLAKLSASQNATCSTRHFSHSFVDGQDEINVFSSSGATVAKLQKISTFCTSFVTSGESRSHNIALATSNFSWRTVGDKEEVSFNKIVGARREDRGYAIGKVIFDGEYINGVGGGVCQVSSTLYNAWIRANLGVISARAHSLPTSYCELSQDATVSDLI